MSWTQQETEFLEKMYGLVSASEIACHLGKTRNMVIGKAYRLGLCRETLNRRWTDHEKALVEAIYPVWGAQRAARVTKRSEDAIRAYASRNEIRFMRMK